MKTQRLLIALTVINLVLLIHLLAESRPTGAQGVTPVLAVMRSKSSTNRDVSERVSTFSQQIQPLRCQVARHTLRR